MQLESITYAQFERQPEEWGITDFSFDNINLIVGRNATGKSRTLNIIAALGNLVSGYIKLKFKLGNYKAIFNRDGKKLTYFLKYKDGKVVQEKLIINSDTKLDRGPGGKGKICAVKANEKNMEFQVPPSELACVNRRDNVQHPFFEDLYKWGKNLRHYRFGGPLGQSSYAVPREDNEKEKKDLDLKETSKTVAIFKKGQEKYPNKFVNNIRTDMLKVGFDFDSISVGPPTSVIFEQGVFKQPQGILVRESDLKGTTDQGSMSQGMFRALSLVIQLNYSLLASVPSCILIDDIGEGLDYERASALIKLIIDKAKKTSVQLIMSTNDRFVMNNVPLEYWSVMRRFPNESKIYNYRNSKKRFEDFELTGLNNFDFFTSDFVVLGTPEDE
jgi:energy-coupling factor transporter ATP-binding protein EcfA2